MPGKDRFPRIRAEQLTQIIFEGEPQSEPAPLVWALGTIAITSPDEFDIAPNVAGQPESGFVRAVYLKRDRQIGGYSLLYPITLS